MLLREPFLRSRHPAPPASAGASWCARSRATGTGSTPSRSARSTPCGPAPSTTPAPRPGTSPRRAFGTTPTHVWGSGARAQRAHRMPIPNSEQAKAQALKRWEEAKGGQPERLVSGSDDFTLFLWNPAEAKAPLARMTGARGGVERAGRRGRTLVGASVLRPVCSSRCRAHAADQPRRLLPQRPLRARPVPPRLAVGGPSSHAAL